MPYTRKQTSDMVVQSYNLDKSFILNKSLIKEYINRLYSGEYFSEIQTYENDAALLTARFFLFNICQYRTCNKGAKKAIRLYF